MTKARDIADFKFENIVDTGTEGTKVATGTSAQRGSTAGQLRFNSDTGLAEYYDGSQFKAIDVPPTVTAISPTEVASLDVGNTTFTITGTNFQSGVTVKFIGNDGTIITASSVTVNSSTSITAVAPNSSFSNSKEPYDIQVINTNNLSGNLNDQIYIDNTLTWNTASGTIATITTASTGTHATVSATDPDGDTIIYSETGGTVLSTAGLTLNSSTGAISGTPNSAGTLNFTLRATANGKNADRAFSITVNAVTLASFLVIGGGGGSNSTSNNYGGGGGAGGYRSSYNSETSGGGGSAETALVLQGGSTYTITVGAGGSGGGGTGATSGIDSSIIGTGVSLISLGGGRSAVSSPAVPDARNGETGGSGGGGVGGGSGASGTANQGYAGGNSPDNNAGGGGGGAGANGNNGSSGNGGSGGSGVASTITGSSVTRGGGGGATGQFNAASGGSGGGAAGTTGAQTTNQNGTANTGGGGGSANGYTGQGIGGSGVVILRMPDADYSGTTTGSPLVTTGVGGTDTVLIFNASGSYTA